METKFSLLRTSEGNILTRCILTKQSCVPQKSTSLVRCTVRSLFENVSFEFSLQTKEILQEEEDLSEIVQLVGKVKAAFFP